MIYITEYDALGNGRTMTRLSRCMETDEGFIPVDDGEDIIFMNTCYDDGTDKAKLLKHFLESDCFEDEQFPETSRAMRYYKGSEGGFMEVCNSLKKLTDESYADGLSKGLSQGHADGIVEGILQGRIQPIKTFLQNGGSEEDAKKLLGATDEEIKEAKKQ